MQAQTLAQGLVCDNCSLVLLSTGIEEREEEGAYVPVSAAVACVGLAISPCSEQWGRPRGEPPGPVLRGRQEEGRLLSISILYLCCE